VNEASRTSRAVVVSWQCSSVVGRLVCDQWDVTLRGPSTAAAAADVTSAEIVSRPPDFASARPQDTVVGPGRGGVSSATLSGSVSGHLLPSPVTVRVLGSG